MIDWSPLRAELAHWREEGRDLAFWWRDDDAVSQTPALDRLTRLADTYAVACHIAVIPKHVDHTLVAACAETSALVPLVHGWAHENHAPTGEKKAEFGHPRTGLRTDVTDGLARMRSLFGAGFLPCFVPPWNRIAPALVAQLHGLGYRALSTYTPRAAREAAPGLVQINTHVDPIYWRGGGGLVPCDVITSQLIATLKARREDHVDATEPLGLLTHHLVHDEAIWTFTEGLLATLLDAGALPINLLNQGDTLP